MDIDCVAEETPDKQHCPPPTPPTLLMLVLKVHSEALLPIETLFAFPSERLWGGPAGFQLEFRHSSQRLEGRRPLRGNSLNRQTRWAPGAVKRRNNKKKKRPLGRELDVTSAGPGAVAQLNPIT